MIDSVCKEIYSKRMKSYSAIAQLVEPSTVNRMVPGSSPGRGAMLLP